MFPSVSGKESGFENICRNEVTSIIEFIERAPTHNPEQGTYLIGSSYGSWISLLTVRMFPEKIKGVVFLSPGIPPEHVSVKMQAENPNLNITNYYESLTHNFERRPGLAIGSKNDKYHSVPTESTLDAAHLLRKDIGSNIEIMDVPSSAHGEELIAESPEVREKIVQWLTSQITKSR